MLLHCSYTKGYKLNTTKMTNNNEKGNQNTGVSDGTKKFKKVF